MEKQKKYTNAYRYIDINWKELKELRLPNIEEVLKQQNIDYDKKKLQYWLNSKKKKIFQKVGTKSMATASVDGDLFGREEELKQEKSTITSKKLSSLPYKSAFKLFKPVVLNE